MPKNSEATVISNMNQPNLAIKISVTIPNNIRRQWIKSVPNKIIWVYKNQPMICPKSQQVTIAKYIN